MEQGLHVFATCPNYKEDACESSSLPKGLT